MIGLEKVAEEFLVKERGKWITRIKRMKNINILQFDGRLFISEEDYKKLKRNKENKFPYDVEIPEGYLTRNEAVDKYGISYSSLRNHEKSGQIKVVKNKNISLLEIKSIEELINDISNIEELKKDDNWIKLSSLLKNKYYDRVTSTIRRNNFKDNVKKMNSGKKQDIFLTKKLYEEIIEGKYIIITEKHEATKVLPEDVNEIIKKLLLNVGVQSAAVKGKLKKLISLEELSKHSKLEIEDIRYNINESEVDINIVNENNKEYIFQYDIENILKFSGYYSLKRLAKVSTIPEETVLSNFKMVNVLKDYMSFKIFKTVYVSIEGIEETLKKYSKIYIATLNLDGILEERAKLLRDELPKTKELAIKFITNKKNCHRKEFGEDKAEFTRIINSVDAFISCLEKEIYLCDSDYLVNLISDTDFIKKGYRPFVCQFVNYVKKELKNKCIYENQFGLSLIQQYTTKKEGEIERIYDKETWAKYYTILKDIDKHIVNSIKNYRYAQTWLYCILNLSVTWRKKNIIISLPRINLEEVGIYDFKWFNEKNDFTLNMANLVLRQIKFSLDGVIAYKNKRNLHFNIPLSLKIPTAIAFVISEIHCRENKKELLLYELNRADTRKTDFKKMFNDDTLVDFKNLKCTRSIISYGYSHAIDTMGGVPAAYKIYSNRRSHSDSERRITNVTGDHYLVLDDLGGGAKEFMFHIIERGAFGFMYYKLFECLLEEETFNNITQQDMTKSIKEVSENVDAITLENLSSKIVGDGNNDQLNMFSVIWGKTLINNINKDKIVKNKDIFLDEMVKLYRDKAKELVGDSEELERFITKKYKDINELINSLKNEEFKFKDSLEKIVSGSNCCYSKDTSCIFDKIDREKKCPYNYVYIGGSSCIGCKYNLTTVYSLYEVSDRLDELLIKIENKGSIGDEEIIKNSYIIKNYLSIIIEAVVHFQDQDFIEGFIDLKNFKKRIINLKNINRVITI